jgi:hypothetical protein
MRAALATLLASLFVLQGCDLSEAQRMDITSQGVESVGPDVQGVELFGAKEISISSLILKASNYEPSRAWYMLVGDTGTTGTGAFVIRGTWNGTTIFSAAQGSGIWDTIPTAGPWMLHPDQLRIECQSPSLGKTWTFAPTFLQDFNEIQWDTAFSRTAVKNGDTLRLKVRIVRGSPGISGTTPVFADYTGLRTVGDYVHYLGPDDTITLSWVVTAAAGGSATLDLGWGSLGESHTFGFSVQ